LNSQEKAIIDKFVKPAEWRVMARRADFNNLAQRFNISPVTARVIVNRGIESEEDIDMYLNGDVSTMHDPALMKDLPKGCEIILEKLRTNKRIRIISDYDVDGVTSNYILLKGMQTVWGHIHGRKPGDCQTVDYDIPHRIYDGYGINKRLIDVAHEDGVDTIITCDNGIAAMYQTTYAKGLGMTVIITDHHVVQYKDDEEGNRIYELPLADAVIDHQQADCAYPFKMLCGAGVAYKFIQYLYKISGVEQEKVHEFVEILGLATNCDVMDLVGENRVYVKSALSSLKNSANPGLNALMRVSGRAGGHVTTYDLGFIIGPCINAAGRLGDARTSLEFLLEEDPIRAEEKAIELVRINNERKDMTNKGVAQIKRMLEEATLSKFGQGGAEGKSGTDNSVAVSEACEKSDSSAATSENSDISVDIGDATLADKVLVVYLPEVHESVVGIIAGRIKEAYARPVLAFTDSDKEGILKGSGRSIESYNMFEELTKVKELFTAFGGHAMAAGFSIKKENLPVLRKRLNELQTLTDYDITPKLMIDVPMPLSYNSIELTEELDKLEPYGKGNRRALFAQAGVKVKKASILGVNKNCLKLALIIDEDGHTISAIDFSPDQFVEDIKEWFGEDECVKMLNGRPNEVVLNIAYYPQVNEYRGKKTLQVKMESYARA
jgi:single-stranded-DNA-specific exonuclease